MMTALIVGDKNVYDRERRASVTALYLWSEMKGFYRLFHKIMEERL